MSAKTAIYIVAMPVIETQDRKIDDLAMFRVSLMPNDFDKLLFAVALTRASQPVIPQNLFVLLGVVTLLIPTTLFGSAGIGGAGLVI